MTPSAMSNASGTSVVAAGPSNRAIILRIDSPIRMNNSASSTKTATDQVARACTRVSGEYVSCWYQPINRPQVVVANTPDTPIASAVRKLAQATMKLAAISRLLSCRRRNSQIEP